MGEKTLPYHCTNANCETYGTSVNVPLGPPCSNCLRPMRREFDVPQYVREATVELRAAESPRTYNFACKGEVIVKSRDLKALLKFIDRNMPDFADKTRES